ncbi:MULTISPECIES: DUF1129 family protein [Gracilibacillus]|uniref:DUF1129 family protein n=1 Tax=Gracilibacillus TaxID=74385 RepID=UPI0008241107|nr:MULTISPECIES: DUF1129 family protein [Gracilibacillus]
MNAKQLIEENNQKREQLNAENETYYEDLLLYIRTDWHVSEQQAEELLLELLNHLLEGQQEEKTAAEIFGDNPKTYADQLIEQLPQEEKGSRFDFVTSLLLQMGAYVLIIRGVLLPVLSLFTEVNSEVNLFSLLLQVLVIAFMVFGIIRYIFYVMHKSVFTVNRAAWKEYVKVGVTAAFGSCVVVLGVIWLPEIGPSFGFPWWLSLLLGVVVAWAAKMMKRK